MSARLTTQEELLARRDADLRARERLFEEQRAEVERRSKDLHQRSATLEADHNVRCSLFNMR